ncbi:MAG: family 43 glycosylhydrolase [Oscillospiraceae bacterium]|nr:family 43 glycosylhydrolase [Oscillospiraceae bacterium]
MKHQCFNPILPSWEYIPDGEPHVFGDRVYLFGSHDIAHGWVFCLGDYVCWSAPVDDLSDWRYEGVIYKRTDDPQNTDGGMCLYAPDVTKGSDGRYYLYYTLDKVNNVSVAVCDTPAGKYEFYGFVRHRDGVNLGEREGDEPQFDPAVLTEGETTYLYTGFCHPGDTSRHGMMATVLDRDMLTVSEEPVFVVPGNCYSKGTGFEGHEYFEAPSIRKVGDMYYLVYSSLLFTELCYATSRNPTKDFKYGGVVVSNCDLNIDSYKPAEKRVFLDGNNHGGIVGVNGNWYIFYHRQTNGTMYSRQACAEAITVGTDGGIRQVEMTSLGMNGKPLSGRGEYSAHIACNLFRADENRQALQPKMTQDGKDGDEINGHIADITDGTVIGFKYFDCAGVRKVTVKTRGYCAGAFEVRTAWDGEVLGTIPVKSANNWTAFSADISIPDGVHALYFVYKGGGSAGLCSFTLE